MKLSQDQIKKIFLSLIGLVALVYCYFSFLLGPLQASQENMISTTAELEGKVAGSKKTMEQTAQLERTAGPAIRLSKTVEVAAYAIDDWLVDFPHADFLVLAKSIARFENENPLWSVASLRLKANEAELGLQTATLGIRTLVKK